MFPMPHMSHSIDETPDGYQTKAPVGPEMHPQDFSIENGLLVFTEAYHLKRGYCCGSGCRHCPYWPRHVQGNTSSA